MHAFTHTKPDSVGQAGMWQLNYHDTMIDQDDAELVAMRFENWKIVFAEQRCQGTLRIWAEPFTPLRVPKLFNLRTDPFEYADITSNTYYDWFMRHDFFVFYATAMASAFLDTFKEFPPRHPPASFSIDQIVEKLQDFLAAD
jgi:arylsulfatase